MDCRDSGELWELVRRFDDGERGSEFMAKLNQVAFACFHDPWETLPPRGPSKANPIPQPILHQALLSTDDLDEEIHSTPTKQGRLPEDDTYDLPSLLRLGQGHLSSEGGDDSEPPKEAKTEKRAEGDSRESSITSFSNLISPGDRKEVDPRLMARLCGALEAVHLQIFIHKGQGLIADLPYDPKSDSQLFMLFRIDPEHKRILVFIQSDLRIPHGFEQEVEDLCLAYNRQHTGLEARTYRPAKGAHMRLQLASELPYDLTSNRNYLVIKLTDLLKRNRQFLVELRNVLPS